MLLLISPLKALTLNKVDFEWGSLLIRAIDTLLLFVLLYGWFFCSKYLLANYVEHYYTFFILPTVLFFVVIGLHCFVAVVHQIKKNDIKLFSCNRQLATSFLYYFSLIRDVIKCCITIVLFAFFVINISPFYFQAKLNNSLPPLLFVLMVFYCLGLLVMTFFRADFKNVQFYYGLKLALGCLCFFLAYVVFVRGRVLYEQQKQCNEIINYAITSTEKRLESIIEELKQA